MRIGYFTNTYLPIIYGSTNSVEYFRKGLELLGHEVFIFAPRSRGFVDTNERVNRYPSIPWKYKIDYPIALSVWPPMGAEIKKLKLDIIHCHQPFSVGKDGLRQAKKNHLPAVFTHHCRYEDYIHYVPPIISHNLLKKYVQRKATDFANQCDQVVAPSRTIKELIQNRGVNAPIEIIPTGIDWEKYQKADGRQIREKYHIVDGEILLVNIGRIEIEKNVEFLFEVVVDLLKKNRKTKFLMVGEGSLKKKFIARMEKENLVGRIFFTGLIAQKEIPDYYAAGDIFLHASKSETQGMTINEAMCAGIPTVAVKATGAMDVIDNWVNGVLVDDSKNEFEKTVEKLMKDEEKRKSLGRAAREKSKNYDYKKQALKLEKIYLRLINQK
ncbi:MAG: glycosyltransferase [Candidatus Moranbacteria bacterium]|nr:glycosyltransferase [Candidatus Moranbacteria bacterium]